jgi:hypothetical protein
VPADALAFLTFRGGDALDGQLKQLNENQMYREGLRELERMVGVPFDRLFSLFENEVAFYIRPGTPIPEFTLLLEAKDEKAALRDVNSIISALSRTLPAQPCHVPAECTDLNGVEISRAAFDGKVVITTQWRAIEKVRSGGPSLEDDDAFKEAREAAGLPDQNSGFVWLDLEDGLPLLLGFADLSGEEIPSEFRRNLEPLRSLVAWAEQDGRTSTAELFLAID